MRLTGHPRLGVWLLLAIGSVTGACGSDGGGGFPADRFGEPVRAAHSSGRAH